jgi:protein-tyrosine phosphatase
VGVVSLLLTPLARGCVAASAFLVVLAAGCTATPVASVMPSSTALALIAAADGPILFHCTEGKDRSGWISALLQLTAGASRAEVTAEYLVSNEFRAGLINAAYRAKLTSSGRTAAEVERALMKVQPDYLGAGLDELKSQFGDIEGYLSKGLGLSAATVQRLRERLTA